MIARILVIVGLLAVAIALFSLSFSDSAAPQFRILFFDVGQGDSVFIESPSGTQVLIDGGNDRAVLRELGRALPFFDRSIDYVVATHPDQDHIGGLVDVFNRYNVTTYIDSGVESGTPAFGALTRAIKREGVAQVTVVEPMRIDLGGGAVMDVLFPDRDVSGIESNASSVILRVVYGEHEFLLTGDAPKSIEEYLVHLYGSALQSDVLKVGHHGSRTSSNSVFVGVVSPQYAVVSAGKDNRFGHPHMEVTDLFEEKEIPLFSTAESGTITFVSDGVSLRIK